MPRPDFDPDSRGARRLADMARHAAEWDRMVAVVAHTKSHLIDDDISLEPGQPADVPAPWAECLVARGSASYVH
jgi:hypothetical protein